MANTYYSLHVHVIFGVYDRLSLISPDVSARLHAYMGAVIKSRNAHPVRIGGVNDHVHILMGITPSSDLSAIVRDIKTSASKWINDNRLCLGRFQWQKGYGAFSVSRSNLEKVANYIDHQAEHHGKMSYSAEFRNLFQAASVKYEEAYLPTDPV